MSISDDTSGQRVVLYFDFLEVSALNKQEVAVAAQALNDIAWLLPAITKDQDWDSGFHLSDSTFLVHEDADGAVTHARHLWKAMFLHDEYQLDIPLELFGLDPVVEEERWKTFPCMPRGCLARGEVRVLGGLRWHPG